MRKAKEMTNLRIGKLVVVGRSGVIDGDGCIQWECLCDCGATKSVRGRELRGGTTTSCGCDKNWRQTDLTGKRYGRIRVIEKTDPIIRLNIREQRRVRTSAYKCICDCGREVVISHGALTSKKQKSCGCYRNEVTAAGRAKYHMAMHGKAMMNQAFQQKKCNARKRSIGFLLSREQYHAVNQGNCHYCGVKPSSVLKSPYSNGDYTYSGIDRVDSEKPYEMGNVVSCCLSCNRAKADMTVEQFKAWLCRCRWHLNETNWKI